MYTRNIVTIILFFFFINFPLSTECMIIIAYIVWNCNKNAGVGARLSSVP